MDLGRLVPGGRLTQGFGMTDYAKSGAYGGGPHTGLDIAAPYNTPIYWPVPMKSVYKGWEPKGYGNFVVGTTADNHQVIFGHMTNFGSGNTAGYVGSTGNSTGPHTHFEVRYGGRAIDPVAWLNKVQSGGGGAALPWSDDQYIPYAEDHARLAYQYHLGYVPSREERRLRLGLPWSKEYGDIVKDPATRAATEQFVLDLFEGTLLRKREVGDGENQVKRSELDQRTNDLLGNKYTPQQLQREFLASNERKAKLDKISKAGVDVQSVEAGFIARIMANIGSFLNSNKSK